MKTHLKKMLGLSALCLGLFTNALPTWAGAVNGQGVSITRSATESYVAGTMVGARYSADGRQYIGCSLGSTLRVQCVAQDSANNFAYCTSTDAKHVREVQAMTDSSYIVFKAKNATATCLMIHIANSSKNLK